jgi:hypothetical protein
MVTSGGELTRRPGRGPAHTTSASQRAVALIDLLDRLLDGGVTIHGQVILSVADVDLVQLDLRLLVSSVDKAAGRK